MNVILLTVNGRDQFIITCDDSVPEGIDTLVHDIRAGLDGGVIILAHGITFEDQRRHTC